MDKTKKKCFRGKNLAGLEKNVEDFIKTVNDKTPIITLTRNVPDYVITVEYDE